MANPFSDIPVIPFTGTALTINPEHYGALIDSTNSGTVTFTLPADAIVGKLVNVKRSGSGQPGFAAASGGSIEAPGGKTKIGEQYGIVTAICTENPSGVAAVWSLSGNLST